MGILDEAIREHLELKRAHGAGDSELKQLEDEAFGQAERPGDEDGAPDPAAEAPTQFMTQPDVPEEGSRREAPTIADLQEAPPAPTPAEEPAAEEVSAEEPADEGAPAEEQPAMEHEIVADVPEAATPEPASEPADESEPAGHTTQERHAIAEQPTELHDMEEELGAPGPPNPTDEELVEEEIAEPRLAPADPLAGLDEDDDAEVSIQGPAVPADEEEDEDDAFWNEQRLSDELDQALEAPVEAESELGDEPELEADEELEPTEAESASPRDEDDVLEETPDFLEEAPEDDQLWFEQKPPKDFDFDD
jgi:hypothetical protein